MSKMDAVRKESGIVVEVLDTTTIRNVAAEIFRKGYPELCEKKKADGYTLKITTETIARCKRPDGVYVLTSDGIISSKPIKGKNTFSMSFHASHKTATKTEAAMFPFACSAVDLEEIEGMPVLETIPLEKFVRTFGGRLEENYRGCLELLLADV